MSLVAPDDTPATEQLIRLITSLAKFPVGRVTGRFTFCPVGLTRMSVLATGKM
ncbi:hypothetical protein DPMN_139943 [Dreissena polymorpha]|uniref:Uncharacterized protein n=1 Tax=Dreissena polymorpha TaxID=45954 RepID=A0A9D4JJX4_DREPO|nr:hypothetical protein DPMN_139943 [Dreissena polymorpha]